MGSPECKFCFHFVIPHMTTQLEMSHSLDFEMLEVQQYTQDCSENFNSLSGRNNPGTFRLLHLQAQSTHSPLYRSIELCGQ